MPQALKYDTSGKARLGRPSNRPERTAVISIATEEAEAAGACLDAVMGLDRPTGFTRGQANITARHRAWARIIRETGCSQYGLSLVWGCDRKAIRWALAKFAPAHIGGQPSARIFARAG